MYWLQYSVFSIFTVASLLGQEADWCVRAYCKFSNHIGSVIFVGGCFRSTTAFDVDYHACCFKFIDQSGDSLMGGLGNVRVPVMKFVCSFSVCSMVLSTKKYQLYTLFQCQHYSSIIIIVTVISIIINHKCVLPKGRSLTASAGT